MSSQTVTYSLPYPAPADPPNVPADIRALAVAADVALRGVSQVGKIARYYQTTAQTGLTGATAVKFDTVHATSPYVTTSTNRDLFTLGLDGWWRIGYGTRIHLGTFTGEAEAFTVIGNAPGSTTTRYGDDNGRSTSNGAVIKCSETVLRPFSKNDTVCINVTANNGGTFSTEPNSESVFISLEWVCPLS